MPQDSPWEIEPEDADTEPEFVEVDPTGRYGRYKEVLGRGAFKKVYRAFDELEGIEVAWNQVKVADLLRNSVNMERLYSEVHLLKTLKHKNIIKFYSSWVDTKKDNINIITEIFTSGTLRQYRKKHKHVDLRALKKWSRQILEGLSYLHGHDPPVIHRDLKCDNIFVNGNQGEVKIGDLGLAAILEQARAAHSVIGTPEFMAPEFYEEEYNELVDIYAFGMCLLELVTLEYPYVECANAAQIYKKVSAGIKPASLGKVKDPEVRMFIEKCIAEVSFRLSAKELLMDPFLQSDEDSRNKGPFLQSDEDSRNKGPFLQSDEDSRNKGPLLQPHPSNADDHGNQFDNGKTPEDSVLEGSRDFMVQGQRKDHNTIFLKLRISDSSGHIRNIHFPFDIDEDTSTAVASEMVEELDLTDHDISVIAAMIDSEIQSHIPDWAPRYLSNDNSFITETALESGQYGANDDASPMANDSIQSSPLVLERLPSGRKYWCDSPKASAGNSPLRPGPSNLMPSDSVASGDSWSEENSLSPNANNSYDASPLRHEVSDSDCDDSNFSEIKRSVHITGNGPHETESDDIKVIVEKLEHVLDDQLKELDELKQKHKLAVSDLLKELPQDVRRRVLSICNKKENLHRKGGPTTDKTVDEGPSTA